MKQIVLNEDTLRELVPKVLEQCGYNIMMNNAISLGFGVVTALNAGQTITYSDPTTAQALSKLVELISKHCASTQQGLGAASLVVESCINNNEKMRGLVKAAQKLLDNIDLVFDADAHVLFSNDMLLVTKFAADNDLV